MTEQVVKYIHPKIDYLTATCDEYGKCRIIWNDELPLVVKGRSDSVFDLEYIEAMGFVSDKVQTQDREPKTGDFVMASFDGDDWYKRIYIAKSVEDYLCVDADNESAYNHGDTFSILRWKFIKPYQYIPKQDWIKNMYTELRTKGTWLPPENLLSELILKHMPKQYRVTVDEIIKWYNEYAGTVTYSRNGLIGDVSEFLKYKNLLQE